MLPSVMVGESAGMLKFCAASEACPAWNATPLSSVVSPFPELIQPYLCGSHGREAAGTQRVPTIGMPQQLKP